MSWKKEIDELKKREKLAEAMGGPEKLKKQKENNKNHNTGIRKTTTCTDKKNNYGICHI